jgi:putative ATP-binding cassette transporter
LARSGLADYADKLDESTHWAKRFSPGEQQRLGFARVFLQRPQFLFLDEATSALDVETERSLYQALIELMPDITVLSVAHRESLAEFHQHTLKLVRAPMDIGAVRRPPTLPEGGGFTPAPAI